MIKIINLHKSFTTVVLFALLGCASESRGPSGSSGENAPCPAVGNLTVEFVGSVGGGESCNISGVLTEDAILRASAEADWELVGAIEVGDGTSSPRLTIEAGATILANEPEHYIYVSPGSSFIANGRSDAPIELVASPGSNAETSGWAGLIIDSNNGDAQIRLSFAVIENAGSGVAINNEDFRAGLSLRGEHEDTQVINVQIHQSVANGVQIASDGDSGAVSGALLENILITGAAENGVVANDFAGLIATLLVVHEEDEGLAGIRLGGSDANAVVINATLVGNDLGLSSGGGDETGIVFEDDLQNARIANSLIIGFRDGCYSEIDGADLSGFALAASPPDTRFVDGLHCIDDNNDAEMLEGNGLPPALQVPDAAATNSGLNFYSGNIQPFEGDFDGSAGFTASWYFRELPGPILNSSTDLRRYNAGVTPADQSLLGFPVLNSEVFTIGVASSLAPGELWIDPTDNEPFDPQPDDDQTILIGYVRSVGTIFDLSYIGAISSDEDTRFDDWAVTTGFLRR